MTETSTGGARRSLRTRTRGWAVALAHALARAGARPNEVSVLGMVFAAGAGIAFMYVSPESAHPALLWIAGAIGVQLRLLCNMLDGMLAIEGGMKGKLGDLWNDIPDRLSDTFILVGAGYGVEWLVPGGSALGWCAALFAAITAYVRVLGGALGTPQYFTGPMAKQHRMFVVTLGALVSALQSVWTRPGLAMAPALVIIVVGSAMTTVRRIEAIARDLQK